MKKIIEKSQEQNCRLCSKPCGKPKIGAEVYHMSCLLKSTRSLRKETGEKKCLQ